MSLTINSATKLDIAKRHYNSYFKQQLTPKITAGIEQAIKKSQQNADGYTLELVITLKPVKVVATK